MKNLNVLIIAALLASTGITYAQTTAPQSTPEQTSVPTTPTSDKKEEFAAPQTPVRPGNTPAEDTLIKGQVSSGAIIKDTLMPSAVKNDKMSRRKNKKRGMNADTALINTRTDSIRKQ
ncbi:hypothetical protein FEM33_00700 [Dyadobacter flavalbus]|uniref:Uncharacterized protein n=1 Tax=Dyadobacter flavalbus TaxID=2579942 RepID=A0A5M8R026_9BACT|nr:hypothetical protein [Dyadobacter flavalbus]KAA6441819.1 hypothetical protein FEM33_00700 [Dyadobacter flavalbus]